MYWLVSAPLLVARFRATGAMSHRYLFMAAGLMAPLGGAVVMVLAGWIEVALRGLRPRWRDGWVWAMVTAGLGAVLLVHSLRPIHQQERYLKLAGVWLAGTLQPDETLVTDQTLVAYYSRRGRDAYQPRFSDYAPGEKRGAVSADRLADRLAEADVVAFELDQGRLQPLDHAELIERLGFVPAVRFEDRGGRCGIQIFTRPTDSPVIVRPGGARARRPGRTSR
jgi:hypothetical protein